MLQDTGIEFYLLCLAYSLSMLLFKGTNKWVVKIKVMRITLFQAFFIDYTILALRTLGHFPHEYPLRDLTVLEWASVFLSVAFLSAFTYEFCQIYQFCNDPRVISNRIPQEKSLERKFRDLVFSDVNPQALDVWFVRNYNWIFIARFNAVIVLIMSF